MQTTYGILNIDNVHTDVSKTLRGAKNYATRNGYKKVSLRQGYNARLISVKTSKGWIDQDSKAHKERKKENPTFNKLLTENK